MARSLRNIEDVVDQENQEVLVDPNSDIEDGEDGDYFTASRRKNTQKRKRNEQDAKRKLKRKV